MNIFFGLLVLLSLLGYCFILRRFLKQTIETTPLIAISFFIVALYVLTYINCLWIGSLILLIIGWALLLALPFYLPRNYDLLLEEYFSPGFIISLFFLILLPSLASQLIIHAWDEYSHWGPHAKLLFYTRDFVKAGSPTVNLTYPPGASLFYFPFFQLGGYSEGIAYFAQTILCLSPLCVILSRFKPKQFIRASIIFLAVLLIILPLFGVIIGYRQTLYMDIPTALFFAGILNYFTQSRKRLTELSLIALMMMSVLLFKPKMYPIASILLIVMMTERFYQLYFLKTDCSFERKQMINKTIFGFLIIVVAILILIWSWSFYLEQGNFRLQWQIPLSMREIVQVFLHLSQDHDRQYIVFHFLSKMLNPVGFILGVFFGLCLLTKIEHKNKNIKNIRLIKHSLLASGFVAYLFGLLLMYLFSFSAFEAHRLASFSRYTHIYYNFWLLVFIFDVVQVLKKIRFPFQKLIERVLLFGLIFGLCLSITLMEKVLFYDKGNVTYLNRHFFRPALSKIVKAIDVYVANGKKLQTIWQGDNGLFRLAFNYTILPKQTKIFNSHYSFGSKYTKNDVWTSKSSPQDLLHEFSKQDYILFGYIDSNFWQHYGKLFKIPYQKWQPITTYRVCINQGRFATHTYPGCKPEIRKGYLFRVARTGDKSFDLQNVISKKTVLVSK